MPYKPFKERWNKKHGLPESAVRGKLSVTKQKRKPVTVNDILARDDVNGILADLNSDKPNMTDLIVLYVDKEGTLHWQFTEDSLTSKVVWMLEAMKFDLLNEGD